LFRELLCLRRARGMIPLASPVARFLPRSADCPKRTLKAVWRGSSTTRRNRDWAAPCARTEGQGDHLTARRRLLLLQGLLCLRRARGMIPLASPVARFLPRSADCPGRTLTAVWGESSTTRRNRDRAAPCVRTEGAGRSSPCPPEAAFASRTFMSPTGKGNDSPCIPRGAISAAVG
jgi:hypothetical protein